MKQNFGNGSLKITISFYLQIITAKLAHHVKICLLIKLNSIFFQKKIAKA